jgi:hypothetical protein
MNLKDYCEGHQPPSLTRALGYSAWEHIRSAEEKVREGVESLVCLEQNVFGGLRELCI